MLLFGTVSSGLAPKPLVTPAETAAKAAQQRAEEQASVAERKAKEAEVKAAKVKMANTSESFFHRFSPNANFIEQRTWLPFVRCTTLVPFIRHPL